MSIKYVSLLILALQIFAWPSLKMSVTKEKNFRSWTVNCVLSASTKSTNPFKTKLLCFLFFSPVTGNNICSVIKNTLAKKFSKCVQTRSLCTVSGWRNWKNCARSLFRRMHRARPDKNLLLAKTQSYHCSISRTLHLQVNIVTKYGGRIIPRGKERICLQGHQGIIGQLWHFVRNDSTTFNNYLIATVLF